MYYVLKNDVLFGPFPSRDVAYHFADNIMAWSVGHYRVMSDALAQQAYIDKPICNPVHVCGQSFN